jgi:hypothetical protein
VESSAPATRPRNWFAVAALWVGLATWLILVGSVVAAETFASGDIFDVVAWVALGFATGALVLAVIGITATRTRGETAVAVLALVLVLSLTTFASPLFLYGSLGD